MASAQPAEPRFATQRNPDRRTLGHEPAEVMAQLGEPPMPWQQQVLDVAYELDEEATEAASSAVGIFQPRLWYRENDLTVPRQSGKTTKAKARHAHRMLKSREYGWGRRPLSFYMAQTATDARDKMVEEWFPAFEENPLFFIEGSKQWQGTPDSPIQQFVRSNGREAIRWLGGGRTTVKPPSRTGGHGGSPDLIDLDEAFAHRDGTAEQGVRPGMITKVSPQLYVVSTAGTAESEYLWGKVDEGRAGCVNPDPTSRRSYFEWSAYPGDTNTPILPGALAVDMRDPDVLHRCSPALGFTITLENLLSEIGMMDPDEGARAYGNIWTRAVRRIISAAAWAGCLDRQSQMVGRLFLAVDASPGHEDGGRTAAISIAGRNGAGRVQMEVIEHAPGLSWVAGRVHELTRKHRGIEKLRIDNTGPIRAIEQDIRDAAACGVETTDASTMAAACQRVHEDILAGVAVHIGQDELDAAAEGAAKRTLGDSWAWARRTSNADICPLVACTEAYWDAINSPMTMQGIM